jgi:hypothetical protein
MEVVKDENELYRRKGMRKRQRKEESLLSEPLDSWMSPRREAP